jgi:hypothetical protein
MPRFRFYLLTLVLTAGLWPGLGRAEAPSGQSRELGIQFETLGGNAWCKPDVSVRLTAGQVAAFDPETVPFVQMIGARWPNGSSSMPGLANLPRPQLKCRDLPLGKCFSQSIRKRESRAVRQTYLTVRSVQRHFYR